MRFADQAEQFRKNGFAVFERALSDEQLELLRANCDDFVAREDARLDAAGADTLGITIRGRRYFANECQREQPDLRRLLFSELMADVCRATLGDTAYFFFDQYVVKGPDGGTSFSWHQDSGYVIHNGGPEDHLPYLTCWIPLDDATVANGTVRLVPGSQTGGVAPHIWRDETKDIAVDVDEAAAVAVEVPAGSIVAFSSHTLHATGSNSTDKPRRVYLAQYTAEAMLNPGTRQLRRNAIPIVQGGRQVTFA
ncbi:phytanoyl-CoA dioxygenase family protein [Sandaracinobacteroides hominis]|uniref:phytanoyl-CoA dioxygenase family protein n=1 Tax=Sandaracinobacteroides hominis TaxID=2780086 RepID=UPI0018F67F9B|nr:phytanoyl-CoA dioxygenase family protein [Sandaracinobacteroides hominis]